VLVSHTAGRPWQGQVEKLRRNTSPNMTHLLPLPGKSSGGRFLTRTTPARCFDNDFAALKPTVRDDRLDLENRGLLVARANLAFAGIASPRATTLPSARCRERYRKRDPYLDCPVRGVGANATDQSRAIFENRGSMMGRAIRIRIARSGLHTQFQTSHGRTGRPGGLRRGP